MHVPEKSATLTAVAEGKKAPDFQLLDQNGKKVKLSKFKGKNANGWRKWSTIATVVAADPGKEFTFDVASTGMKVARWGYTLEAVEGGTKVTEHWTDHRAKLMAKITGLVVGVKDRAAHNKAGMEHTLERLAAAV